MDYPKDEYQSPLALQTVDDFPCRHRFLVSPLPTACFAEVSPDTFFARTPLSFGGC